MEPTECWIIQSFFPSTLCPLMSPTLPQWTKHVQTCARMVGQPHSRRGVGQVRQPLPPSKSRYCHWYDRGVCGIRGCGVENVGQRGCTCNLVTRWIKVVEVGGSS